MRTIQISSILFCLFMGTLSANAQVGGGQEFTPDYIEYHAQYVPVTPNASSFTVYGNTPINTATGVPQINIPIFNIVEDGVSVPISLSYNASGVMVDQLSSVVGLKWSLNAGGGVFRQVNDKEDELGWLYPHLRGYIDSDWFATNTHDDYYTQVSILDDSAQNDDYFPDDFSYNFGGYSGAFIFNQNGNISKEYEDNVLIEKLDGTGNILNFRTKDGLGNTYFFGNDVEINSTNVATSGGGTNLSFTFDRNPNVSGWMMDRIQTKNDREISFTYEPYTLQYTIFNVANNIVQVSGCQTIDSRTGTPVSGEVYCGCELDNTSNRTHLSKTSIQYSPLNQLIKTIDSQTVLVTFNYGTDTSLSTWQKKLVSIDILDKLKNKTKSFVFTYGKFDGDPRLRLDGVQEIGFDGTAKPPYIFTYEAGNLPVKGSTSKDFSGYYNGKINNSLVPESATAIANLNEPFRSFLADRTPDIDYLKIGTLKTITYPTGGATSFFYEPNIGTASPAYYLGGLRTKKVIDKDHNGQFAKQTDYSYDGIKGYSFESNVGNTSKSYGRKKVFSSDNLTLNPSLIKSGHFYERVTIEQIGTQDTLRTVQKYSEKYRNKSFDSQMVREEIYRGDFMVRSMDMEYNNTIEDIIQYYILGDKDQCFSRFITNTSNNIPSFSLGYFGYGTAYLSHYRQRRNELVKRTQIDYFEDGSGTFSGIVTQNRYTYNDRLLPYSQELDGRFLVTSLQNAQNGVFTPYPEGEHQRVEYTYPDDHASLSTLTTGHLTGVPVTKKVFDKQRQTLGQAMELDNNGNVTAVYRYAKGEGNNTATSAHIPDDYELHTRFLLDRGKPVQVTRDRGAHATMLWDRTKNYVMAQLQNVSKIQLDAFITTKNIAGITSQGVDLSLVNENTLNSFYSDLRANFHKAQISSYIHDPLIGVTSMTDPRGYTMGYEYDGFNRLKQVKDADGFILSENTYHYKGQ